MWQTRAGGPVPCTGRPGGPRADLEPSRSGSLLVLPEGPRMKRPGRGGGTACPRVLGAAASGRRSSRKFASRLCAPSGRTSRPPTPPATLSLASPLAGMGTRLFPPAATVILLQRKGLPTPCPPPPSRTCHCGWHLFVPLNWLLSCPFSKFSRTEKPAELGRFPLLQVQRGRSLPGGGHAGVTPRQARWRSPGTGVHFCPGVRGRPRQRRPWGRGWGGEGRPPPPPPHRLSPAQPRPRRPNGGESGAETSS